MPHFQVIVVGGGIAGLCLAQGLKQAGVSVAVYERDRSRTDRLEGFRLHINPAGSRALHACLPAPIWRRFVATAGESVSLGFVTEKLHELTVIVDDSQRADTPEAERAYAADRLTLRQLLLEGLDDVVRFDRTFTHYETKGDTVAAFFADGSTATANVLVGADGANSRVRRQYLPNAERVETGAIGVASKLPLTDQTRSWLPPRLASAMNMVIAPAPYFLFTSAFDPDQPAEHPERAYDSYVLCAFVGQQRAFRRKLDDLHQHELQRTVESMLTRWHPAFRRLIGESDPDSVMLVQHLAAQSVPPWQTTHVTLLGDAIHSMPPVGGLGGNTALRDANLLCRKLTSAFRGTSPLRPWIQSYEAEMREYGFAAVRTAVQAQAQGLVSNPALVAGQRLWFRLSSAVPALMLKNQPYAEWVQPRPWELEPAPWLQAAESARRQGVAV